MSDFAERAGTVDVADSQGRYTWTQTIEDVVVTIPIPTGTRSADLEYALTTHTLRVAVGGTAI